MHQARISASNAASPIRPQHIDGLAGGGKDRSTTSGKQEVDESVGAEAVVADGGISSEDGKEDEVTAQGGSGEDTEESQEVQVPKVATDPCQPTARARALHDLLHMPFRTWCYDCLQGQGKDRYHLRIQDESGVPRIAIDYMFLIERGVTRQASEADTWSKDGECVTVLILKDFRFKSIWAYPVEHKGTLKTEWVVDAIIGDLVTCGLGNCRIVTKSDQEASIVNVQNEIVKARLKAGAGATALENSRVGDSSSNGTVERAVQDFGGLVRTYRSALQRRLGGEKILLNHPAVPWLVKHAASQITRYKVRASGLTSYQLIKGRKCIEPMAEFGEAVLFRPLKTLLEVKHKNSWSDRYVEGIYLGNDIRTSENIIGTVHGVYRAGQIRRRSPDERWSAAAVKAIVGCPQQPVPGANSAMPTYVRPELRGEEKPGAQTNFAPQAPDEGPKIRGLYVRKEDIDLYGATAQCLGCKCVTAHKKYWRPHTE